MKSKSLALTDHRELTPAIWEMIRSMAPVMHQSRLFGVTSVDQAAAIMLKGYELGLSITAAFEFIQVIEGKPSLAPRGALAILHNHADVKMQISKVLSSTGQFLGYTCTMQRISSGFEYTSHFSLEDAQRAGLVRTGSGWAKYPENMCLWRAVGFCADVVAPDILAGMTSAMKINDDIEPGGYESPVMVTVQPVSTSEPIQETVSLEALVTQYGADAIVAACGGIIPSTEQDLIEAKKKLSGIMA